MSLRTLLNFTHAAFVEDLVEIGATRAAAREAIDEALSEPLDPAEREERKRKARALESAQGAAGLMASFGMDG